MHYISINDLREFLEGKIAYLNKHKDRVKDDKYAHCESMIHAYEYVISLIRNMRRVDIDEKTKEVTEYD